MGNWDTNDALEYHENTKHSYVSVRLRGRGLDWENMPYPFKVYPDAPRVELPSSFPSPTATLFEALRRPESRTLREIELPLIAELLFYSAGITRIKDYGWGRVYFRAAAATGNLHETELYLVVGGGGDLEPGVYHFDPCEFCLSQIRRGDYRQRLARSTRSAEVLESGLTVVLSSVAWRNAWKYGPRSYRHWFWDGGALCANLLAVSRAEGLEPEVLMGFVDEEVNALIGAEQPREAAIAVVALKGLESSHPGSSPSTDPIRYRPMPYSRREVQYREIAEAHASSCLRDADEVARWRDGAGRLRPTSDLEPPAASWLWADLRPLPLGEAILLRGSARRFTQTPIRGEVLRAVTWAMCAPIEADFVPRGLTTLLERFAIVNAVDGLDPGSYLHERGSLELRLLKPGNFRRVAGYLCLEQGLGSDASVVFFLMARLGEVLGHMGNRGYRAVQFEAGVRVGLAYLVAYSLGIGATGLTFYDDVREFFAPASDGMENMMVVALGNPSYRSRPGRIHVRECRHPAFRRS
ncbi:MAG: SagB/ThcOx family dehydrogenase [Thaumarchaeota archaeon]|nr:SagB/ThcOx family dehydrogenase [Candidatus Calditenuaceae archaeon]MDW8186728.1 SagB/ThcOx family dehydrogenase [Nitrososphaerota archaeon]